MGNAMDFDKIRKRRRRIQLLKRMAVLLAIALVLLGILSLNSMLVSGGFITRVRDFFGGLGGDGYPIAAPGGALRDVKALEGDIAVLNDTNLYVYSKKGKELLGVQRMTENTVALTAGSRVLTYELGGTKFKIHTRQSLLVDEEHDYAISSMALGERGDYAVVSASKQYTAQVTVYDHQFEMAFQWSSNELVSGVALHPKGGRMAAGSVGASGGVLRSAIRLFSFDTGETARVELENEMLLNLVYLDEEHVGILTDKGYHVMNSAGSIIGGVDFGGERLAIARFFKGEALLLCENTEARSQMLLLVDAKGRETASASPDGMVRDLALGSNIWLLTDTGIVRCDKSLVRTGGADASGVSRILLANQVLYYFTDSEICVMDQALFAPEQASSESSS